jgi:hypothetical protein
LSSIRHSSIRLFALTLLIAGRALAQDHMPSEIHAEMNPATSYAAPSTTTAALPDSPVPHRVIDKKFIIVMGMLGGAESLRFSSRKLVLDNEFAAGAPWVTSVPANQHLVAKYASIYAAELLVAYELKKPHSWLPGDRIIRKFWWAYPSAMVAIHVKNGIGNMRTQGPGGCTSIECAEQMP